jgi:hypothetical protein
MDERLKFIADYARGEWDLAELCRRYEVGRKTGYKWLARYESEGGAGLLDGRGGLGLARTVPRRGWKRLWSSYVSSIHLLIVVALIFWVLHLLRGGPARA